MYVHESVKDYYVHLAGKRLMLNREATLHCARMGLLMGWPTLRHLAQLHTPARFVQLEQARYRRRAARRSRRLIDRVWQ